MPPTWEETLMQTQNLLRSWLGKPRITQKKVESTAEDAWNDLQPDLR